MMLVVGDTVWISLIGAIFSFLTAVLAAIVTIVTLKTKTTMQELEKNTNSMKDALVKVTAESEFAKGLKEGLKEGNGSPAQ